MSVCVCGSGTLSLVRGVRSLLYLLSISLSVCSLPLCICVCVCGSGILSLVRGVSSLLCLLSISMSVYSLPLYVCLCVVVVFCLWSGE